MTELIVEYTDDGVTKRAALSIEDPDMPGDQLAALLLGAADMIMGRSQRQFAAVIEQAKSFGIVFGADGAVTDLRQRG
jgi:hypothetical protein